MGVMRIASQIGLNTQVSAIYGAVVTRYLMANLQEICYKILLEIPWAQAPWRYIGQQRDSQVLARPGIVPRHRLYKYPGRKAFKVLWLL